MVQPRFFLLLTLAVLSLASLPALAEEAKALRGDQSRVSQLRVKYHLQVSRETVQDEPRRFVLIEGAYSRPGWALFIGKVKLRLDARGYFKAKTHVPGKEKTLSLLAVGPEGQKEKEELRIQLDSDENPSDQASPHSFFVGTSVESLSYQQDASTLSSAVQIHQKTLSFQGGYGYLLSPPEWSVALHLEMTGLALSSDLPGTTARFITGDLSVGYDLPRVSGSWSALISGGGFYTTMRVSPNEFGFKNLSGLQLSAQLRHPHGRNSFSGGLSYTPISTNGFGLSGLSGYHLGLTAEYAWRLRSGNSIPLTLSYSRLSTSLGTDADEAISIPVLTSSVSLGIGYRF